ncbi:MAG: SufD family Fe-S cluster assembly protein, partial [Acidimicrobiales bacterium]
RVRGPHSALAILYDGIPVVFELSPDADNGHGESKDAGKNTDGDTGRDIRIILELPGQSEPDFLSLFSTHEWPDALREIHDGFGPAPAILHIPDGVTVKQPIVVVNVASGLSPALASSNGRSGEIDGNRANETRGSNGGNGNDEGGSGERDSRIPTSFSTLGIDLGANARASVVEIVTAMPLPSNSTDGKRVGPLQTDTSNAGEPSSFHELAGSSFRDGAGARPCSLNLPVTLTRLGEDSALDHVNVQVLPWGFWQVSYIQSVVARGAQLRSLTVSLGGTYARTVTESTLAGDRGTTELLAAYLGSGNQLHDMRTVQRHVAQRTASNLLFVGAVGDRARAVYSGLIKMEPGAKRSEALQTNRNLILSEGARADSVPNLSIEENDVRCSHASSTGPVDPEQIYYLESRGIEPADAKRLVVKGFFSDIYTKNPVPQTGEWLVDEIGNRLSGMDVSRSTPIHAFSTSSEDSTSTVLRGGNSA